MSGKTKSFLLVALQFLLFGYLFLTGPLIPNNTFSWVIFLAGLFIGLWALWTMRTTSFRITPDIAKGAVLIENGPYTWVRHPMYLSFIMVAFSLLHNYSTTSRFLMVGALIAVLVIKIQYEEELLHVHFTKYKDYIRKTHRLIPFLY